MSHVVNPQADFYCFNCENIVSELYEAVWPDGAKFGAMGAPLCFRCAGKAQEMLPRYRRLDLQPPPEQRIQGQEHGQQNQHGGEQTEISHTVCE